MKKMNEISAGYEVSQIYTFRLGGYDQKVLIEGKTKALPVVIFLHGGPGTPIPFNAGCRGLFPEFTDRFLMVYWDQLGCGINNCELDENLKISHFVTMAADLCREIKKLFPENKLLLFGTSWGSVLSAKLLEQKAPVEGVVVCGQITHDLLFNEPVKKTLESSRIPAAKLELIRSIERQLITQEDLKLLSTSLQKYTDAYQNRKGKNPPMWPVIKGLLASPDYRIRDLKAVMVNGYTKNSALFTSLFQELLKLDLRPILKETPVPYHMIQGDTDVVDTSAFVQKLTETAGNPNLTLEVIQNAGHYPNMDTMDRVLQALCSLSA